MELSAMSKTVDHKPSNLNQELKILFIDDDEIQIIIMSAFIKQLEGNVPYHTEMNGKTALEYLKGIKPEHFPEMIVVDINMPVMDGFEFIYEYEKQFMEHHKDTQLFMLSSSIRDEDQQKALNFRSVKGFYSKPLTKSILTKMIDRTASMQEE